MTEVERVVELMRIGFDTLEQDLNPEIAVTAEQLEEYRDTLRRWEETLAVQPTPKNEVPAKAAPSYNTFR